MLDTSISQFYYSFKFKINTLNFSYFCHIIDLFQSWSSLQQSYQSALIDYMQWAHALRASPQSKLKQHEETLVQIINQHETKREKHFLSESRLFILTKQDEPWTWLFASQVHAHTLHVLFSEVRLELMTTSPCALHTWASRCSTNSLGLRSKAVCVAQTCPINISPICLETCYFFFFKYCAKVLSCPSFKNK